ncbi:MAG: hypothetical protein E7554_10585 [Ruminococcaceae bacterium]|nr:hypothetical protein [Oscillospiraceae bacterium]
MGQSNYNKASLKVKENGGHEKGKLDKVYRNVLYVLGAVLVALLIFAVLVSTKVINCTNSSELVFEDKTTGISYYRASVINSEGTNYEPIFYFIDADGDRIDCFTDEELTSVFYEDENGETKEVLVDGGEIGKNAEGKVLMSEFNPYTYFYNLAGKYYFINDNGERVECRLSSDYTKILYNDAEGKEHEFILVNTSGSDVSGTDVSGSDVSKTDAQ